MVNSGSPHSCRYGSAAPPNAFLGGVLPAAFVFLLCLLAAFGARASAQEPAAPARPNILLILADEFSPKLAAAEGGTLGIARAFDRVAASGIRFERAYANTPWTPNSRASILTGRTPKANGIGPAATRLSPFAVTIAHLLRFRGYLTAAFGGVDPERGTDAFEISRSIGDAAAALPPAPARTPFPFPTAGPWDCFRDPLMLARHSAGPVAATFEEMPETRLAREAADFLRAAPADRPFFVCLALRDPEAPRAYPVEYADRFPPDSIALPEVSAEEAALAPRAIREMSPERRRALVAGRLATAAYLEDCRAIVLDALDESGRAADTVVIHMGETGGISGTEGPMERPSLREEAIRIALAVRWPGVTHPGTVSAALVESVDVFPTIARIAGANVRHPIEGRNFAPVLTGSENSARSEVVCVFPEFEFEPESAAIFDGRYKLVHRPALREAFVAKDALAEPGRDAPRTTLHDRETDPEERIDLADRPEHAARVAALTDRLIERLTEHDPYSPVPAPGDAPRAARLEAALAPAERLAQAAEEIRRVQGK